MTTFESVRFGTVEIADEQAIEFPDGLVGLGGLRYALIDRNPGSGFLWLHSLEDPALALPVVSRHLFFEDFRLELREEDREHTGLADLEGASVYVTVRATPDPLDITVNLRAPLIVRDRRGWQLLNEAEGAQLQAPLFTPAASEPALAPPQPSADAA